MNLSVKKTNDGSATLFNASLNEPYHSVHGALTESLHVFIQNGFIPALQVTQTELRILEIGFGTGLNAALTTAEAENNSKHVHYTALEPFPVYKELLDQLDYKSILTVKQHTYFEKIHEADWERTTQINSSFQCIKTQQGIMDFQAHDKFDLIYFDAFAPEKQPDMWQIPVFQKCYKLLNPQGIFITYCAKGQFKRDMKSCGFKVEAKPGPPFKREITFATKPY